MHGLFDYLSKIDPTALLAVLTALIGYLKHHKDANAADALKTALAGALRSEVAILTSDPDVYAKARERLEDAATSLLGRLGIHRSKLVDKIVHAAVEHALAELAERLIAMNMAAAASGAQDVADHGFEPPTNPKVPSLGFDLTSAPPGEPAAEPSVVVGEPERSAAAAERVRAMLRKRPSRGPR